jgi:Sulfatase-modifying factor enzyme 1
MKRLLERRVLSIAAVGLELLFVFGFANVAVPATTVPHAFTSGEKALAGEVNDNFNALATAIDTISLTPGPQGPAGSPDTANQVRDKFFTGTSCVGNSADDKMVRVGPLCVDKYEASVWSNADGTGTPYGVLPGQTTYPGGFPENGNWTTAVYAVSKAGVLPSTSVTWFQAQQACALSGKRLLTNAEWQMAAANTPDSTICNVSGGFVANTGSYAGCVSNWGVNDMVGNAGEWVADWIQGNANPWAPSGGNAGTDYGDDLMNGTNPAGNKSVNSANFPTALVRGGYPNNGPDDGVFALDARSAPSFSDGDIGFRCAR